MGGDSPNFLLDNKVHVNLDGTERNLQWGSSSRRLSIDITGDAEFGAGPLAPASPIQTEVKLNFDVDNTDLNGKFMKVYAGKEYSIVFQPGFTMPSIKVGA